MKLIFLITILLLTTCKSAQHDPSFLADTNITQDPWGQQNFEVLFTNPVCPPKKYTRYRPRFDNDYIQIDGRQAYPKRDDIAMIELTSKGIPTIGGGFRKVIPQGIHCSSKDMSQSIIAAADSPYRHKDPPLVRLLEWLDGTKAGDEIFSASFSFSSRPVVTSLCKAADRGAKVKVFINKPSRINGTIKKLLEECTNIETLQYKQKGRLAHAKMFLILHRNQDHTPKRLNQAYLTFESANVSSGTWGHHENWNFIKQAESNWFIQDHICLRDAITAPNLANLGNLYQSISSCRKAKKINSKRQNQIIANFFVPKSGGQYNDRKELLQVFDEIDKSQKVQIEIHHLSHKKIFAKLAQKLDTDPDFKLFILLDNELYWSGATISRKIVLDEIHYYAHDDFSNHCFSYKSESELRTIKEKMRSCSLINAFEWHGIKKLMVKGAKVRFVENNFRAKKLWHNKIAIFTYKHPDSFGNSKSVFSGAGNFSKAAFQRNFENFYLIKIPHVVSAYEKHFDYFWQNALEEQDLPTTWDYEVVELPLEAVMQ